MWKEIIEKERKQIEEDYNSLLTMFSNDKKEEKENKRTEGYLYKFVNEKLKKLYFVLFENNIYCKYHYIYNSNSNYYFTYINIHIKKNQTIKTKKMVYTKACILYQAHT